MFTLNHLSVTAHTRNIISVLKPVMFWFLHVYIKKAVDLFRGTKQIQYNYSVPARTIPSRHPVRNCSLETRLYSRCRLVAYSKMRKCFFSLILKIKQLLLCVKCQTSLTSTLISSFVDYF